MQLLGARTRRARHLKRRPFAHSIGGITTSAHVKGPPNTSAAGLAECEDCIMDILVSDFGSRHAQFMQCLRTSLTGAPIVDVA
jgi:hypothetical protein